jgi:hypothetical protein
MPTKKDSKVDPVGIVGFHNAMQRLAQVPKAEVDKEEAKWQRMQARAAERRKAKGKKKR